MWILFLRLLSNNSLSAAPYIAVKGGQKKGEVKTSEGEIAEIGTRGKKSKRRRGKETAWRTVLSLDLEGSAEVLAPLASLQQRTDTCVLFK